MPATLPPVKVFLSITKSQRLPLSKLVFKNKTKNNFLFPIVQLIYTWK